MACGKMTVRVCRDRKGRFAEQGKASKKRPSGKKKLSKKAHCKPKSIWKDRRGVCHCKTRGGGVRTVSASKCKKAPPK